MGKPHRAVWSSQWFVSGMHRVPCWWGPGRQRKKLFCHSCPRRTFGLGNECVYGTLVGKGLRSGSALVLLRQILLLCRTLLCPLLAPLGSVVFPVSSDWFEEIFLMLLSPRMVRAVLDCCPSGLMAAGHGLMLLWPCSEVLREWSA